MTMIMDDSQIRTIEQIRAILKSSKGLGFKGVSRSEKYSWIERVLDRFGYFSLNKKDKGAVKAYLLRMTGFSRAQVTRLIARKRAGGPIEPPSRWRHRFKIKYTAFDKEILAQTDNAHGRLSGPATRRILERQYSIYGDKKFERLKDISSAHIYNLRSSRTYRLRAQTFAKTKSVQVKIGVRRRPDPKGRPGWIRVDTVHQGDMDKEKGVYHVNMVDSAIQWEIVACAEKISERFLAPVLEGALQTFPFQILGFHSDNGSEYINEVVAKLLNKLLIEQTKSRSGRTNDNALVEGKNGSVIRKHMGYWHIKQRHAPVINEFYRDYFNVYLNFHRPCGFATVTVDEKGRRRKKYETYRTPYERFKSLKSARRYLRPGVTFEALDEIAGRHTDNEFARMMQRVKDGLFGELLSGKNARGSSRKEQRNEKGGLVQKTTTALRRDFSGSLLN